MPIQSRTRGIALRIVGWLVQLLCTGIELFLNWMAMAGVAGVWPLRKPEIWFAPACILIIPLFVRVFGWGRRLTVRGRRYLSPILSPGQLPKRPFVLYLRSFDDDSAWQELESIGRGMPGATLHDIVRSTRTQEEQLITALKPAGHVVALGRPGERLPFAGAQRMYLPHDAWQAAVLDLMRQARLVVMSAGTSHGLMWELLQAVRNLNPNQLVLIVNMDSESYLEFREMATREFSVAARQLYMDTGQEWCPPALPASLPEHSRPATRAWIILFADDWTAKPAALDIPQNDMALSRKQTEKSLSRVLQPIFEGSPGEVAVFKPVLSSLSATDRR